MERETYAGVTRHLHRSKFSLLAHRALALGLIVAVAFALFWVGLIALFVGLGIAIVGAGIRLLVMNNKRSADPHVWEGDYTEVRVEERSEAVRY